MSNCMYCNRPLPNATECHDEFRREELCDIIRQHGIYKDLLRELAKAYESYSDAGVRLKMKYSWVDAHMKLRELMEQAKQEIGNE